VHIGMVCARTSGLQGQCAKRRGMHAGTVCTHERHAHGDRVHEDGVRKDCMIEGKVCARRACVQARAVSAGEACAHRNTRQGGQCPRGHKTAG